MSNRAFSVVELDPTPETLVKWFGAPAFDELDFRAREATTKEAREIESLRTPDRTMHLTDVPLRERAEFAADLLAATDAMGLQVERVCVIGSWARGDAIPLVSDLDCRLVVAEPVGWHEFWWVVRTLRVDVGPAILPEPFGFLDAFPAPFEPADDWVSLIQ